MFQFQIYPTGVPSSYKVMVNSPHGVTAIQDRRMGIIEHSLSGVAFYIKAINDYINVHNVGTSISPIVSGFFNHVGFNDYQIETALANTLDGIISGVYNVYSSGVFITDSYPDVEDLYVSSGLFSNTIFNKSIQDNNIISSFNFTDIKNLYSGYVTTPSDLKLYSTQQVIGSKETYPYNLGASGVLNNIGIRSRLEINNNAVGFFKDSFTADAFTLYNLNGVLSNNTYIFGSYTSNLTSYTGATFHESIFQLKSHTHNGVNSSLLKLSNFNSTKSITKPFIISQSQQSTISKDGFKGNGIGLSSNWELVDVNDISNIQNIYTCKGRLYITDDTRLYEYGSDRTIEALEAYPRSLVIASNAGDTPALVELVKSTDYILNGDIDNVTGIIITAFNNPYVNNRISFPYRGLNSAFTMIQSRKEIPIDRCTRIGGKIYIMFLEEITEGNGLSPRKVLSLYEIDTINNPMSIKIVAHCDLTDHGTDWRFITPVRFKNSVTYFFCNTESPEENFTLVYNTIFHPPKETVTFQIGQLTKNVVHNFEDTPGERVGFNFFKNDMYIPTRRSTTNISYYDGQAICSFGNNYSFDISQRNTVNIYSTGCDVVYGGMLMSDCGSFSNGMDGSAYELHTQIKIQLRKITGSRYPWATSYTIYDGWLYAIAPTIPYGSYHTPGWTNDYPNTESRINMNTYLPNGCLLVRMRASELNLTSAKSYTS